MILQVLPSVSPHDAISQHVLRLDDELKKRNIESQVVSNYIHPSFSNRVISPIMVDSFDDHHILYHMSIASALAEKIHASNARVDMWYHNVTPAHFFEPWEPYVSLELRIARHQLSQLAVRVDRGVAASKYSQDELIQQGCRHTSVMPVLFDVDAKLQDKSMSTTKSGTQILSVGRYAPHKRVELLIQTLALYHDLVDENATLELVGTSSSQWYKESLDELIEKLELKDSVRFHDNIGDDSLSDLYHQSDVYLCLSEHEGFCVPLVEAQYAGLPIVAKQYAAIEETVHGAGITLPIDSNLIDVVAGIETITKNAAVRTRLESQAALNVKERDINKEAQLAVDWLLEGSS